MTDLVDKKKTLLDADVKVRRRGEGKDDTSYRLDIDEIYPLTQQETDMISEKRIELSEYFKPHTNEQILRILQGEKWEDVMKSQTEDTPSEDDEDIEIQ